MNPSKFVLVLSILFSLFFIPVKTFADSTTGLTYFSLGLGLQVANEQLEQSTGAQSYIQAFQVSPQTSFAYDVANWGALVFTFDVSPAISSSINDPNPIFSQVIEKGTSFLI